jgi:hypothetical protein
VHQAAATRSRDWQQLMCMDGRPRHPSVAVRFDKPAREVERQEPHYPG